MPSSIVLLLLANWNDAFGRICTTELLLTSAPSEAPKANVRLERSLPLPATLFGPEPMLKLAIGHTSAVRFVSSGIEYPPARPKSNDEPPRPSYDVVPTPAFPYKPFGAP